MRRFLTSLGVVMMLCLVCSSCKEDDQVNYPVSVDGLWTEANASTGYSCNVLFTSNDSEGPMCELNLANADQKTRNTFQGKYTYDQSTGTATFSSDSKGAPTATFQYNEAGEVLAASIKSTALDYGTYNLSKTTYPSNIAGTWSGESKGYKLAVAFESYTVDGSTPITVTWGSGPKDTATGTYTYNNATGVLTADVTSAHYGIQFKYNVSTNVLDGEILGLTISLDRIPTVISVFSKRGATEVWL